MARPAPRGGGIYLLFHSDSEYRGFGLHILVTPTFLDSMSGVSAVSLKLPGFWSAQPEVWFLQAEAQFAIRDITKDETKYYYVVAALDQVTASRLLAFLKAPPATDKYEKLKECLLGTYGKSKRERAAELLRMPGLGGRKPSELLDEMRALMGSHEKCFLFEQLFLDQLPAEIHMQLAEEDFSDLVALGQRADALWTARGQGAVNEVAPESDTECDINASSFNPNTRRRKLCRFHAKFGKNAYRCVKPCDWTENANAGRQRK